MAEQRDVLQVLRTTALVAVVALIGVAPHLYYLTAVAFPDRLRERFGPLGVAPAIEAELASVGFVVVVAALMGTAFAERYRLPGLGRLAALGEARWLILALAPVLSLGTYALFGRAIALRVPGYYPDGLGWAAARTIKEALFDEIVARYGMMTILCGMVRRVWLANVLQALFFTALAALGLSFYGVAATASPYLVASLGASVALHGVLGAVYARYGLLCAMAFHLVLGSKYLVHAALG